jgi:elongation factor Ts
MEITAQMVKELRDRTNAGMMECKTALKESSGDIDAAIKYLRQAGSIKAAKKADRDAKEGTVAAHLDDDSKHGTLVEINCETDFVAKNENFQAFVAELIGAVAASGASDLETASAVPHRDGTIDDLVKAKVIELGENLQFRRVARFDVEGSGVVASYIHPPGKVGVLLEVGCGNDAAAADEGFRELVKDLTLHIAAAAPAGLSRDDIPADVIEGEMEIARKDLERKGVPAERLEGALKGKINKFYSEKCFLEQGFVKDPDSTIRSLVEAKGKELGDTITVRRFVRFAVGE